MSFLPYGRQTVSKKDINSVIKILESDFLTTGPTVENFENDFKTHVQASYAAACSSGTAALHLAAMALELQPGDYIIVPSITFAATANAIRYTGAEILFSDVDPETGLMQPEHLERTIRSHRDKNIRAVFLVHLNGQCTQLPEIQKIANHYNLHIVEDACHALGTNYTYQNKTYTVGSCAHSDLAIFSFHAVKTIACGEGGMVTCEDERLIEQIHRLRNHGITRKANTFLNKENAFEKNHINPWYYEIESLGFNYRLSDIHCALGKSQLTKLAKFKTKRQHLFSAYQEKLSGLDSIKLVEQLPENDPCWHLCVILINFKEIGMSRRQFMAELRTHEIGSQVHYLPVYQHPYYKKRYGSMRLNGAQEYYNQCLSLPLYPSMQVEDVEYVTDVITQLIHQRRKACA